MKLATEILLDSAIQGAAILAIANILALLLGRQAATRHLVWTLCAAVLLMLPVGNALLPPLRLQSVLWRTDRQGSQVSPMANVGAALVEVFGNWPTTGKRGARHEASDHGLDATPGNGKVTGGARAQPGEPSKFYRWLQRNRIVVVHWLLFIWGIGAVIVLARPAAGFYSLGFLARRSRPPEGSAWRSSIERLARAGVPVHKARILTSRHRAMPMAWGLFRATILLPEEAAQWPFEWFEIAVRHEFAHIERRDCLATLLARLAVGLYWWNPLAWRLVHRVEIEQEFACDDRVLVGGARPSAYAEIILAIASGNAFDSIEALGVALASNRGSALEARVRALLDLHRRLAPVRPEIRVLAIGAAVLVAGSASALRLAASESSLTSRATAVRPLPERAPANVAATDESPATQRNSWPRFETVGVALDHPLSKPDGDASSRELTPRPESQNTETPSPLADGLVARWRGDGNCKDSSGEHHGGEIDKRPFVSGLNGDAFVFVPKSKAQEPVNIADSSDFYLSESMTVCFWIHPLAWKGVVISRADTISGLDAWRFDLENRGSLSFCFNSSDSHSSSLRAPVSLHQWHHIAVTFDHGDVKIYVNGVLQGENKTEYRPIGAFEALSAPRLTIGNAAGAEQSHSMVGALQDVRIYRRPLEPAEIATVIKD